MGTVDLGSCECCNITQPCCTDSVGNTDWPLPSTLYFFSQCMNVVGAPLTLVADHPENDTNCTYRGTVTCENGPSFEVEVQVIGSTGVTSLTTPGNPPQLNGTQNCLPYYVIGRVLPELFPGCTCLVPPHPNDRWTISE